MVNYGILILHPFPRHYGVAKDSSPTHNQDTISC